MASPDDPLTEDEFESLWKIFEGAGGNVLETYKLRLRAAGYIKDGPDGMVITESGQRRLARGKPT